jgi:prepilin-type N-terminal cleavage/methylation domain-containing protein
MRRNGFTLTELLVVILIIFVISVIALPVVVSSMRGRQATAAAQLLQGALAGARDHAIHTGLPSGLRLLPDPTLAGCYDRLIPIEPAPDYSEGLCTVRPGAVYPRNRTNPAGADVAWPSLILESAPTLADINRTPVAPTSWFWNLRVGDRLQIGGTGPWYTIVGPAWVASSEQFVNAGPPGTKIAEWLILTDGIDDNGNGYPDDWADGIDNDGNGLIDDIVETLFNWGYPPGSPALHQQPGQSFPAEAETWQGVAAGGLEAVPYLVRRRPMPGPDARALILPASIVIEAARGMLPVNPDGSVEVLVNPDGTAGPVLPYGVPTSLSMGLAFIHFALVDRSDTGTAPAVPKDPWSIVSLARSGRITITEDPDPATPFAYALRGGP